MEGFAPKKIAEEWDNVGLQIGSPTQSVSTTYVSLDINEAVLDEALA